MEAYLQSSFARDSHQIHWAEYGDPAGAPLLLVHGASGNTLPMARMTALEGQPFRMIELHQRGVGLSLPSGMTESNTLQDNLDDMESLRQLLDIPQWTILSWSFGATLMTGYAFEHPERCAALVSYAPFLGSQEDYDVLAEKKPDDAALYFTAQGTTKAKEIARKFLENARAADVMTRKESCYLAQRVWDPLLDKDAFMAGKTEAEWDALLQGRAVSAGHYHALYHEKDRFLEALAHEKGALTLPVTLIYGENDGWSGFHAYAAELFAHPVICGVDGAGHGIDHPGVQATLKRELALL